MHKRAFTIIELLLYLAILSSSILMLSSFINMVSAARAKNSAIAEVEQQGGEIAYVLRQAIVASNGINAPATGTSAVALNLSFPDALRNPTIFNITNNKVTIKEGTSSVINLNNDQVIASNIVFYNRSRVGTNGSLTARFTLSSATSTARQEFLYSKVFNVTATRRY